MQFTVILQRKPVGQRSGTWKQDHKGRWHPSRPLWSLCSSLHMFLWCCWAFSAELQGDAVLTALSFWTMCPRHRLLCSTDVHNREFSHDVNKDLFVQWCSIYISISKTLEPLKAIAKLFYLKTLCKDGYPPFCHGARQSVTSYLWIFDYYLCKIMWFVDCFLFKDSLLRTLRTLLCLREIEEDSTPVYRTNHPYLQSQHVSQTYIEIPYNDLLVYMVSFKTLVPRHVSKLYFCITKDQSSLTAC